MSRIIVTTNVTLDGVMQGPAAAEEDTRDGFALGGWANPYADEVLGAAMAEQMATTGGLLFGRRTYEHFYAVWPHRTDGNPYTEKLNNTQKYVASTTLTEPLPWQNSTVLGTGTRESTMDDVAELRRRSGPDIVVLGSGDLIASLRRHGLVDEYVVVVYPIVLGAGRRLFAGDGTTTALALVDTTTTPRGVVIATYRPAEAH